MADYKAKIEAEYEAIEKTLTSLPEASLPELSKLERQKIKGQASVY